MKHIRIFETVADFEAAKASLAKPNIGLIEETGNSYVISSGSEPEVDYSKVAMFFENVDTQDVTIGVEQSTSFTSSISLQTSTDGETWEDWGRVMFNLTKNIPVGGKLYIRADNIYNAFNDKNNSMYSNYFKSTGKVNVGGNIMSLGYKDFENETSIYLSAAFKYVFYKMTNLVDASKLVLPATTLTQKCYEYMFYGCTSLTKAPVLPATTLAAGCYGYMFKGCSNLNYIKAMFTTTPSSSYTDNWLNGVASTGTFVKNAAATWDVTGVNGVPEGWTVKTATAE